LQYYPFVDGTKLKSGVRTLQERRDFASITDHLPLSEVFVENNLTNLLFEFFKLLNIACTTPLNQNVSEKYDAQFYNSVLCKNTFEQFVCDNNIIAENVNKFTAFQFQISGH
jgi:ASC-1-like (ASCH) protein